LNGVDAEIAPHAVAIFEAEELLADMADRFDDDAHTGWPAARSRRVLPHARHCAPLGAQIDEEAVVAVDRQPRHRLTLVRTVPLPSLPVDSAISCSAQAPKSATFGEAKIVTLSRLRGRRCHRKAKLHAGVFMRRHVRRRRNAPSRVCGRAGADVDAGRRRRTRPTGRGRKAAADRGIAEKMRAKPCLIATFCSAEPGSVTAMK